MKARTMGRRAALNLEDRRWEISSLLLDDDAVLLDQSQEQMQQLERGFDNVCKRRNLRVNVGKSKRMLFQRTTDSQCRISVIEQANENVRDFKYLKSVLLNKYGRPTGEVEQRVKQGRKIPES